MAEVTVERRRLWGSIWEAGDLLAWHEDGRYGVMLCVKERVVGPRGGLREPAESVAIRSSSWTAVCDAVQDEGFTRPTLRARDITGSPHKKLSALGATRDARSPK